MDNEYIKIQCGLKDKLLFLFTSLIRKEYLINNTYTSNTPRLVKNKETVTNIKNEEIPDKIDIPFFELDNTDKSDVESNL